MQQENKNKILIILCWSAVAVCMAVIFYFSSRTTVESARQSSGILDFLTEIFGDNKFTDFIIRKSAHCLEFAGLALLFNCAFYFTKNQTAMITSVICTSLYAVSDEIHQIFVDGRSCEFRDWAIDTTGAVLGTIGFAVIYVIIKTIVKKRQNTD